MNSEASNEGDLNMNGENEKNASEELKDIVGEDSDNAAAWTAQFKKNFSGD